MPYYVHTCQQVKFSELTMDMFRMLQTLEREPQDDFNHIYDASPAPGRVPLVSICSWLQFFLFSLLFLKKKIESNK